MGPIAMLSFTRTIFCIYLNDYPQTLDDSLFGLVINLARYFFLWVACGWISNDSDVWHAQSGP